MNTNLIHHESAHRLGDSATRLIDPPWSALAALRLPGDSSQQRRLPCRARLSRSLSPFALSTGAQAPVEPQRSPLPAHPMTAHTGASNYRF